MLNGDTSCNVIYNQLSTRLQFFTLFLIYCGSYLMCHGRCAIWASTCNKWANGSTKYRVQWRLLLFAIVNQARRASRYNGKKIFALQWLLVYHFRRIFRIILYAVVIAIIIYDDRYLRSSQFPNIVMNIQRLLTRGKPGDQNSCFSANISSSRIHFVTRFGYFS